MQKFMSTYLKAQTELAKEQWKELKAQVEALAERVREQRERVVELELQLACYRSATEGGQCSWCDVLH